jgi:Kef-type K+ transport system membrane component KefB
MTNGELGAILFAMLLLLVAATLLGQLFARFRQPKVVGEILAGVLLGPTLLGEVAPGFAADVFGADESDPRTIVLAFLYNLGLLLLMFGSGCAVKRLLGKENRKPTAWILGLGTPLPFFIAMVVAPLLPLEHFTGSAGSESAVVLVFAAAAAVTSIPVITKIFADLGILHTRFASLLLGSAVLEDIILWGVLSVATAIAAATVAAAGDDLTATISGHVAVNAAFVIVSLTVMPAVLRKLSRARWNVLAQKSHVSWMLVVLLAYVTLAAELEVTLAFAAFLAGFGVMGGMRATEHVRFNVASHSIGVVASALFVPMYFALIGYRLDFSKTFNPIMTAGFLIGTSVVALLAVGLGAKLAGMNRLDIANIAIVQNARGGPGIVMASVAFDAGIINGAFFTSLVVTAVLTSQAAGFWLDYVLRKGWPLLSGADLIKRGIDPELDEELPRPGSRPAPELIGTES